MASRAGARLQRKDLSFVNFHLYPPFGGEGLYAGAPVLGQFSATIDKIYAAATDAGSWNEALASVEQLTDSAGVVVNLVASENFRESVMLTSPRLQAHFDARDFEEYEQNLLPICPRVAAGLANPTAPYVCDRQILSEAEMERDPVYDWFGRHGLQYFIGSPLAETQGFKMMWSLQRTRAQGHVQGPEIQIFELLKPHVARALALADQLGTLKSFDRFSSAMLEALPQAVFALDENGVVLFVNAAGRQLLASRDGLEMRAGRLGAAIKSEQAHFDASVRTALAPVGARDPGWVRITRPSGRRPYAVFIAPLSVADEHLLAAEARILVLVHDTASQRCASVEMLMSIYGLTECEARLASALSGGHSLESAAAFFCIQPTTARSHLKSIFRKLGVGRQQDLVRMLTSLSTIAPAESNGGAAR